MEALVKKVPHCTTIVPPNKGRLGSVKSGFGERWIRGQARVEESLFFKDKAKPVEISFFLGEHGTEYNLHYVK